MFLNVGPLSATDKLQTEFVAARFVVVSEQRLLQHIPKRIGHSTALDDAIKCVCSPYPSIGSPLVDTNGSMVAGRLYSRALRSLNRALSDTQESQSSETLAAAILLQMFEHSVDHAEFRWVVHANGVIKMLELRGPDNVQNELDLSILGAQVGNIFFNAIRDYSDCFLADPKWVPVIQEALLGPINKNGTWNDEFPAMILAGLGVPGIIRRYEQLQSRWKGRVLAPSCDAPEYERKTYHVSLIDELRELRRVLLEWRERNEATHFQNHTTNPSQTGSSPRIWHASRLSIYAFITMTNFMLIDLGSALFHFEEELATLLTQSHALTSNAAFECDALRQVDNIAARQTSTLLFMTLTRVLDASPSHEDHKNPVRSYVDDILQYLRGDG